MSSLQVFLGSTNRDLATERLLIQEMLEALAKETEGFGYFAPRSQPALGTSLEAVAGSDLALFVLGHNYGAMAPGYQVSQAEREYQEALDRGVPILGFIREEDYALLPGQFEKEPIRQLKIRDFRAALSKGHCLSFGDAPSLASAIRKALEAEISVRGLPHRHTPRIFIPSSPTSVPDPGAAAPSADMAESQTRTLPTLQKELNRPFAARNLHTGHGWLWIAGFAAVFLLLAGAFAAWKYSQWRKAHATPPAGSQDAAPVLPESEAGGNSEDADTLIVTSDEDSALAALAAAHSGDAKARHDLAERYDKGHGLPRNDSLAFKYYHLAARQGHAESQYKLAQFYRQGRGTSRSPRRARSWLTAASERGHAAAQSALGRMFLRGEGGAPPNPGEGYKWLLRAAEKQDSAALQILAELKQE